MICTNLPSWSSSKTNESRREKGGAASSVAWRGIKTSVLIQRRRISLPLSFSLSHKARAHSPPMTSPSTLLSRYTHTARGYIEKENARKVYSRVAGRKRELIKARTRRSSRPRNPVVVVVNGDAADATRARMWDRKLNIATRGKSRWFFFFHRPRGHTAAAACGLLTLETSALATDGSLDRR